MEPGFEVEALINNQSWLQKLCDDPRVQEALKVAEESKTELFIPQGEYRIGKPLMPLAGS